ncbi:homocysteine S-methyltransferase family protein [Pontivivens insulae]|uniref:Homocysteine S-methyltransferase n=1 Tax=Pontivivens insulae TaxID=1639689 RepID=A0A2R8A804_9RHOB|nr:homocysteine S-methyltransferase family protein [Pontivivens insulae]RED18463.1 homocysteine S-methyltransferase [Pontivivens insulae]SPF28361.1 Homocysteine S-methyltransferase [Pontivivens insulae]
MAEIVLLDGGMGQELVARNDADPTPMWSARVLADRPDLVEAVHRDFFEAGATVATLNTYSVTPERLHRHAPDEDTDALFERLQAAAIRVASAARGDRDVALAGCLPPLAWSYRPDAAPPQGLMQQTYARLVAAQGDHCDLMLAETMSGVREAGAATRAIVAAGHLAWIALSVDDRDGTRLRSGEPLEDGISAVAEAGADAILLNCSRPEAIAQGLPILATVHVPFGAYANGFEFAGDLEFGGTVKGLTKRLELTPEAYADHAMTWIAAGATIVGGCCEVGPAHIAHLAQRIRAAGHRVVRP